MDYSACSVLYLDRRAKEVGTLTSKSLDRCIQEGLASLGEEEAGNNIHVILSTFGEAYVCCDGVSCLGTIAQLDEAQNPGPILVLLDMPQDDDTDSLRVSWDSRIPTTAALTRPKVERDEPADLYGMHLLLHLASEIKQRVRSRLVIPIAVLGSKWLADPFRISRYLDHGAVDVLTSPLSAERVQGLSVHAYRRFKEMSMEESSFLLEKRSRKLSWVGLDEDRPYAYLREVMVSGLMNGICNPETVGESIDPGELHIRPERMVDVEMAIGSWSFSAHDFDADELLFACRIMLEHALQMPELERWRISANDLTTFLMACRKAYNDFVLYHNFRHIVDVLQAVFFSLLRMEVLPPYPSGEPAGKVNRSPITMLLQPFDALTLLVSAIGHDVGHPGVNNAFLVALNAPLAQLYNDRSVLEAFHCAAYSQILRRYWPEAFSDMGMRRLMINSILATDMGLHFKYMIDMGNLQERLAANKNSVEGWAPKVVEEARDLCCGLLIKCADISNVARKHDVAAQWAAILTDEFSNQGAMEKELNLPTCLFGGPPDREDPIKMAESQIGFINIFAAPLFEGVTNLLPCMQYTVEELDLNRSIWERKIDTEKARLGSLLHSPSGPDVFIASPPYSAADNDLENESEYLSPLPVERDSLLPLSYSFRGGEEGSKNVQDSKAKTHNEPSSTVERRWRGASMSSASPAKSHRQPSGGATSAFAHQRTASRRSSKDAALEQLEQMHLSSFSRVENPGMDTSRRGSADASLTTILVHSQTGQNKQESPSHSQTSSPPRRTPRSSSRPSHSGGCSSLPSSRSNATSNTMATTTVPEAPSTRASSIAEQDSYEPEGRKEVYTMPTTNTYLRPGPHAVDSRHTSAPDILAIRGMDQSKTSLAPPIASDISEDGDEGGRGGRQGIRQSRSRSRLRGLRFWRKRWKSPGAGVEVEGSE